MNLKEKINLAKERGFNIYMLVNRYYKVSKIVDRLPEEVVEAVTDEFILRGDKVRDHWPYFIKVLTMKSHAYFAKRSMEEGEKHKNEPTNLRDILRQIMK
jgi:hypothetical protein